MPMAPMAVAHNSIMIFFCKQEYTRFPGLPEPYPAPEIMGDWLINQITPSYASFRLEPFAGWRRKSDDSESENDIPGRI